MNQSRVGLIGLSLTLIVLLVALNIGRVTDLFGHKTYTAEFSRAGGLRDGDSVEISGVKVGSVSDIALDGDQVKITFTASQVDLGDKTQASIKSANALGRKFLDISPAGAGDVANIPSSRTVRPYDVTNALSDLTTTTQQLNVNQLAGSFDSLADVFKDTAPELGSTLKGVTGLSQTIASRDAALRSLLKRANSVTGVLSNRSVAITQIIANGDSLLQELQLRQLVIRELLASTQTAASQLRKLVNENKAVIGPTLTKLARVSEVLEHNKSNIEFALRELGPYARSVGESVGGGPFYFAYVANLVAPSNLATEVFPGLIRTDG
jgi:phospholipid/cholesterol/gamma-HCH transport system substrate-binding protein